MFRPPVMQQPSDAVKSSESSPSSSAGRPEAAGGEAQPCPTAGGAWPETDHAALASLRAGAPAEREAALCQIFTAYTPALRRYMRHHWPLLPPADIDDLTSEFLTRCLAGDNAHFLSYNPDWGGSQTRLRTYLCCILENFLRNHYSTTHTQSRGGDRQFQSLNTINPAPHHETRADGSASPPGVDIEAYDRHWAQHIIQVSFHALENASPATREWLPILRPWILADPGETSLKEIARARGCTDTALRAQLHRLRKAWRQAVRQAVARTVADPDDVDDELRHLATVLARHPVEW
jgi:RNA polymerase sigma-70 factor (ECF subfamily)